MTIISKKQMSEEDIKLQYITPAITAKWDIKKITMETHITDGKINLKGNFVTREKPKRADYVLYLNSNNPIAIVEAKDNKHSISHGLQQAMAYASMLDIPFAYSSNGDGFFEHDFLTGKERELNLQREKKMLLLSLSHDIKTPLSAIKLYSKALSKGLYTDKEKQLEIAENINAKADEIEGYVAEIITASREDFLSLDVNMGEFYLSELVTKIKLYYTEKLSLIKTDFFVGEYGDCLISGDLDRSVEVVQNIMENAIKYGDGKKISISFSEEEGCILIAVKNSGCTLPDTDLPHIFESFWRGANAENLKGSGLGLYICRQLMHKMNGEVFAQIKGGDMCVTAVFGKTSCDRRV